MMPRPTFNINCLLTKKLRKSKNVSPFLSISDLSPAHQQFQQQSPLHHSKTGSGGCGTPQHRNSNSNNSNLKLTGGSRDRSSSTELCAPSEEDDETENATDIEEIPRDQVPIIKDPGSTPPPNPATTALSADQEAKHKEFIEKLMKDFDDDNPHDHILPGEDHEDDDDDESRSCFIPERRISRANSEKAIQIIKENSEILDKILRKKGERMGGGPPGELQSSPLTPLPYPSPDPDPAGSKPSLSSRPSVESVMSSSNLSCSSSQNNINLPPQPTPSVCSQSSGKSSFSGKLSSSNPPAQASSATKPITSNPFPTRPVARRKRQEVGRKLGLYSSAS